jgi:hypothetical protein
MLVLIWSFRVTLNAGTDETSAGHGNGTLHPLSVDQDVFSIIMKTFKLPDKVREVICSIHGVFARFVEYYDDGDGNSPKSLRMPIPPAYTCSVQTDDRYIVILLSTPKAPVREIFCAMRITPSSNTVTCLLFDAQPTDLGHILEFVHNINYVSAWQTALHLLIYLTRELGHTSESKRQILDNAILGAEVQTKSTPWDDPSKALVRWPNDIHEATSVLHLCHNNLLFVGRAVGFEVDVWRWLHKLVGGSSSASRDGEVLAWLRGGDARAGAWAALIDSIEFEMVHTVNRKAQIGCLKERIGVQINLVSFPFP